MVVLRIGDLPVGQLDLPADQLPLGGARLRSLAAAAITPAVGQRLVGRWFDGWLPELRPSRPRADPPRVSEVAAIADPLARLALERVGAEGPLSVSVVVCTRDRSASLRGTLTALAQLAPAPFEVLVVDNSKGDEATRRVVASFMGVRYLCEPRPGLSAARNAGLRATTGEIIAFTDDDVRPEPTWLARLNACFRGDDVGAVTGLVLPSSLSTDGALAFEHGFGGFGAGYRRMRFDLAFLHGMRWHTPPTWKIGAGANMAVRRRVVDLAGGFDERLGAGAAGCSEDSELWHRVLAAGFTCQYEPAAVVAHAHREDLPAVRAQLRAYMKGHVTALAIQLLRDGQAGEARRVLANLPMHYTTRLLKQHVRSTPDVTLRAEARGYVDGLRHVPEALRRDAGNATRHRRLWTVLAQRPDVELALARAAHRIAPHDAAAQALEIGPPSGLTSALFGGADVSQEDGTMPGALPYRDGTFDVVTLFDTLDEHPRPLSLVSEAQRVLAPGGSLLMSTRKGFDAAALVGRPPLAAQAFRARGARTAAWWRGPLSGRLTQVP